MSILIVPVGTMEGESLKTIAEALVVFGKKVKVGHGLPEPDYAYDQQRKQAAAYPIIDQMQHHKEYHFHERVLGVVDRDLFVPGLNFVFGVASRRVAIVSLTRLRQEYYDLPPDPGSFLLRVKTEAVHEMGHTYGLGHCINPRCVMFLSNTLADTDAKSATFCAACQAYLDRHRRAGH
jgi:archaemetzincin